jgi:copper(I)-binding protein
MKILSVGLLLGLCACAAIAPVVNGQPPASVQVDRAWVHAAPKGQFETWAFATISNSGKADALVEVHSPDAQSVVLRATTLTDAGRKTRSVLAIPIPAAGNFALSPDTYFIALIQAKHAFRPGETVAATLRFASGQSVPVAFRVSDAEGDPADAGN